MFKFLSKNKENITLTIIFIVISSFFILGILSLYNSNIYNKKINLINKNIEIINSNVSLTGSLNGNILNLNLENIGGKNILGLKIVTEFSDVFGNTLKAKIDTGNIISNIENNFQYNNLIVIEDKINKLDKLRKNINLIFEKKDFKKSNIKNLKIIEIIFDDKTHINIINNCHGLYYKNNLCDDYNYIY